MSRSLHRNACLVGLGFGDEGKGSIVDYLSGRYSPYGPRHFSTVVRFNGGAQAGHRVVTGDGRQHVFSQFGSGYFNGTLTHLSQHSLVDPLALVSEAEELDRKSVGRAFGTITIDRNALLTTPFHSAANKAAEVARGADRHGSCGMGIGETMRFFLAHPDDAPRVGDAQDRKTLQKKLYALHDYYIGVVPTEDMPPIGLLLDVYREFANFAKIVDERFLPLLMQHSNVLFEGAQGVLLDQDYGFHPYTTWSRTTTANIKDLPDVEVIGVIRAYATRHGAGPFPTEVEAYAALAPDVANVDGQWQGNFRVGNFDLVLARYAADVLRHLGTPLDQVALTNVDRVPAGMVYAGAYQTEDHVVTGLTLAVPGSRSQQEALTKGLVKAQPVPYRFAEDEEGQDAIAAALGAPITIRSRGPKAEHKALRRAVPV